MAVSHCFATNWTCYKQKRREGGQGGGGAIAPLMFSRTTFLNSNSSNSGVKIAGGGGEADDLGNYNVYEYTFLQPCHFNCIFP